ncbi:hypothetical protein [Acetobacter sicerae]
MQRLIDLLALGKKRRAIQFIQFMTAEIFINLQQLRLDLRRLDHNGLSLFDPGNLHRLHAMRASYKHIQMAILRPHGLANLDRLTLPDLLHAGRNHRSIVRINRTQARPDINLCQRNGFHVHAATPFAR